MYVLNPFFRKKVTLRIVSVHVSQSVVQRGKPFKNQMISIPMELFARLQQTKVRYFSLFYCIHKFTFLRIPTESFEVGIFGNFKHDIDKALSKVFEIDTF